ncbi:MAG TPA: DUF882 domain-containing protein [Polyangia bacterium]|nr:DUF882 domain-containing protein [Polyangia bacterium]
MLVLLTLLALPVEPTALEASATDGVFDPVAARAEHLVPAAPRLFSKKEDWLREKAARPDRHTSDDDLARVTGTKVAAKPKAKAKLYASAAPLGPDPGGKPGLRIEPVTTLYNVWTHEALPLLPGQTQDTLASRFFPFLRDHYTNQATRMDTRLIDVLARVADKFRAKRIEVVSGYRSPKYNLMLRKKGHQVARHSQHMEGNAVDFRIRGVPTKVVLGYVKSLHLGGVGFYPHSQFVHSDTGPVRYWTGS